MLYDITGNVVDESESAENVPTWKDEDAISDSSAQIVRVSDKIKAVVTVEERIPATDSFLDTKIFGDLSYRDVFVTRNKVPNFWDFESTSSDWTPFYINAGTPHITTSDAYLGNGSLDISGSSSQQFRGNITGSLFVAMKVKVTRYERGKVGVISSLVLNGVTDGWVTLCGMVNDVTYFGSGDSANLDGFIDCLVITPAVSNVEIDEFKKRYEEFLDIKSGGDVTVTTEKTYTLSNDSSDSSGDGSGGESEDDTPDYSYAECRQAFYSAMNKKASDMGLSTGNFTSASGLTNNLLTVMDMAKMAVEACGYKDIAQVWGKDNYSISIGGNNPKIVNLSTTVKDSALENYYTFLGGKTGTLGDDTHTLIGVCVVNGVYVAGAISGATSDSGRFSAMKQLMDIAKTVLNGGTNSATVTDATRAVALRVPAINVFNYEKQTPIVLYEQNSSEQTKPASVTKVMTCMVLCDYVSDLNERFVWKSADSGRFDDGDKVSFKEAMYCMLLPSDNNAAEAVARVVGERILTKYSS